MPLSSDIDGLAYVSLAQLIGHQAHARGLGFCVPQRAGSRLVGHHGSRLRGRGLSFEELRHYQPGDDLRQVDWRLTLRTGHPHVRSYSEDRERPALILVDQRMSMFFGSCRSLKSALACELGALCGWIALYGGDRVGGLLFNDQRIDLIAPRRGRRQVERLCAGLVRQNHELHAGNPAIDSAARLDEVLLECLKLARHDQLICLVSDFAGAGERTGLLLRQLAARNQLIALQVYDPRALAPIVRQRLRVTQGESALDLPLGNRAVRQVLAELLRARLDAVGELLCRSRVPSLRFSTAEPALAQLRRQLGAQAGWQG
ncbi:DUF58 domain-containing protein [Pseudomonas sp. NPDC086581]|uniref:DUF58 domain-containing protein n=1 Tax=Pseudomonas sp. NPDC086581 TaxID=3364432 RepID=UPI0037FEFE56